MSDEEKEPTTFPLLFFPDGLFNPEFDPDGEYQPDSDITDDQWYTGAADPKHGH